MAAAAAKGPTKRWLMQALPREARTSADLAAEPDAAVYGETP